jgi:nucleoid-associated protein YgaU
VFERGSRYENVPDALHVREDGREIPYKALRTPVEAPVQQVHAVSGGDRLDLLGHAYLGAPEQWWRICDANRTLRPADLVSEAGRKITIPMPLT